MTRIKLKQISEIYMYLFIEKGLRGRISYICKRYSEANNECVKNHDPGKPSKHIIYLDENNLYGWGTSRYLLYGEFKWLIQEKLNKFDVNSIKENSSTGYIFEVDLEYPDELHQLHNDYPLTPEKLAISYDMLSNQCKKLLINIE